MLLPNSQKSATLATGFHQNRKRVSLLANSRHHFDSNVRGRHIIVSANIFSWKKEKAASRIFADCVVVLFGRRPECPGNKKGEKMFFCACVRSYMNNTNQLGAFSRRQSSYSRTTTLRGRNACAKCTLGTFTLECLAHVPLLSLSLLFHLFVCFL